MKRRMFLAAGAVIAASGCLGGDGEEVDSNGSDPPEGSNARDAPNYDVDQIRSEAEYIPYDELIRDIETFEGHAAHYPWGEVLQAFPDDVDMLRIDIGQTPSDWGNDVIAYYYGEDRLVEEDMIELWGVVEGVESYETILGEERTVPVITLVDFEEFEHDEVVELGIGEVYHSPQQIEVAVLDIELADSYEYEDYRGAIDLAEPDDGNQWCFVTFEARNNSGSAERIPLDRHVVVLIGDQQYDRELISDDPVNHNLDEYDGGEVQDGVVRTGWIIYQIPADASRSDLEIVWSDSIFDLEWSVYWSE